MQSRMDKYQTSKPKRYERTKKNTKLYEDVYDDIYRDTTYQNMQVIDSAKEININKLKNIIDDKYDTRQYRTLQNYSVEDDSYDESLLNNRQRVYDINQIISDAKNKRSFIEEAKEKQKYLNYDDHRVKNADDYSGLENEEKELEELINTITIPKENTNNEDESELDLFSDLKGSENTIVTNPIDASFEVDTNEFNNKDKEEKIEKTASRADKTFYTDSNMFTKNDFEDFNTLSNELTSTSKAKKIVIVVLVLAILAAIGYYVTTKFILK